MPPLTYLWIATALLIIALVIAVVKARAMHAKDENELPPQETMIIIDEATDVLDPKVWRKPKQMKSRPRNRK